ncbi:chemotaxis protein CheB [Aliikangiella maris]|uniref:protein-glutamate methylesterase n=2 Tax=Aliikangiella maris TaxID=3162458 RepID=A0ABV3MT63_9GAMM
MSGLKLGLVASASDETEQLTQLLQLNAVNILHNLKPEQITDEHVDDEALHVWLLCVDDDSWHDAVDHLLDESAVPVYFSEPGALAKQTHPEYWCDNLVNRLFEMAGLERDGASSTEEDLSITSQAGESLSLDIVQSTAATTTDDSVEQQTRALSNSLDELASSTVDLPSDIAAELVSELESLSPVLSGNQNVLSGQAAVEDNFTAKDFVNSEDSILLDESVVVDTVNIDAAAIDDVEIDDADTIELELDDFELDESEVDIAESQDFESSGESTDNDFAALDDSITLDDEIALVELSLDDDFSGQTHTASSEVSSLETQENLELDFELEKAADELTLVIDEDEPAKASGKAQFFIDESDELPSQAANNESLSPLEKQPSDIIEPRQFADVNENDFELSLMLEDEPKPVSGKAQFIIDDDFNESEHSSAEQGAPHQSSKPTLPNEPSTLINENVSGSKLDGTGLSLAPMDDASKTELDYSLDHTVNNYEVEENKTLAEETELNLDETELSFAENEFSLETEDITLDENDDFDLLLEETGHSLDEFELDTAENYSVNPSQADSQNLSEPVVNDEAFDDVNLDGTDLDTFELATFDLEQSPLEQTTIDQTQFDQQRSESAQIDSVELVEMDIDSDVIHQVSLSATSIQEIARKALDDTPTKATKLSPTSTETPSSTDAVKDPVQAVPAEKTQSVTSESIVEPVIEIPMLDEAVFNIEFEEQQVKTTPKSALTPCWVIGASLGGPAAVKRFLNRIPANVNASFIIAQHIDENFLPVLADILTNNSEFDVAIANGSIELVPGKTVLAPLKGKITILKDGSMLIDHSQKWSAPYSPCIDDVIEAVGHVYGHMSGAIIFSGMGEDGLNGALKMKSAGGQVWAQSIDTCANGSMPEAIINNDLAEYIGSPEQLADKLVRFLRGVPN